MNRLARIIGAAFPVTDPRAIADAKARDAEADRATLETMQTRTGIRMNNVATIPHKPIDDQADQAIARLMQQATAAAESTGETFRKAMQQIVETQSREIDRLRKVVADISKERPRKIVSIASCKMKSDHGGDVDAVVATATDGTVWRGDRWISGWTRAADLPQPDSELGK